MCKVETVTALNPREVDDHDAKGDKRSPFEATRLGGVQVFRS